MCKIGCRLLGFRAALLIAWLIAANLVAAADPATLAPAPIPTTPGADERLEGPAWLKAYRFPEQKFTFARVRYESAASRVEHWATDYPDADRALSSELARLTSLDVSAETAVLKLTDRSLTRYPLIYMSEPGHLALSDAEVAALRAYLRSGGFLMADDFWGEAEWSHFATELKRVLPDVEPIDLPLDHAIFHTVFDFKAKPQVCSIHAAFAGREQGVTWERDDAKQVHYWGLSDAKGRLMAVLCHNTDLGDGWERGEDDAWYRQTFSIPRALPMGVNIVFYALTR